MRRKCSDSAHCPLQTYTNTRLSSASTIRPNGLATEADTTIRCQHCGSTPLPANRSGRRWHTRWDTHSTTCATATTPSKAPSRPATPDSTTPSEAERLCGRRRPTGRLFTPIQTRCFLKAGLDTISATRTTTRSHTNITATRHTCSSSIFANTTTTYRPFTKCGPSPCLRLRTSTRLS